jgi:hypothetical protein
MAGKLEPRYGPFRGISIIERPDTYAVASGLARTFARHIHGKPLRLELAHQVIGIAAIGKATQLHSESRCRLGGRSSAFK